mmetsp:Transcript_2764/g.3789  ORF Transcript_2764/g.3789 Transcript_2764/m.3789 type:complete len:96 (-) Transcript_2764:1116-1403(-)
MGHEVVRLAPITERAHRYEVVDVCSISLELIQLGSGCFGTSGGRPVLILKRNGVRLRGNTNLGSMGIIVLSENCLGLISLGLIRTVLRSLEVVLF